jgi:predicted lipoprotein
MALGLTFAPSLGLAQTGGTVATPYYSAEHVLQGLYGHRLPPLASAFRTEAERLVQATEQHCAGQAPLAAVQARWQGTHAAWVQLSVPAVGPLIARRSQRQIDFWPTRPDFLQRAMQRQPASLEDMTRIGAPAKGFPALEVLLDRWTADSASTTPQACRYAVLIAQGIAAEAQGLERDVGEWARRDWTEDGPTTQAALAEWVNQWLGGLEHLRWAHIEKPITTHRTSGQAEKGLPVPFARQNMARNLQDWRTRWASLLAQGRQAPGTPAPAPGTALPPIESLLAGKGHLALAQQWARSLDAVTARMDALTPDASEASLMALATQLKAVTVQFQNEVAPALDIRLGFSDADGD